MDIDSQKERERCALTIVAADFALEWLRPLPPSLKFVGPLLPEPARPLPADLEVGSFLFWLQENSQSTCLLWHAYPAQACPQTLRVGSPKKSATIS